MDVISAGPLMSFVGFIYTFWIFFFFHQFYSRMTYLLCSSYSFRGNYSFLNLEIQRSQYIRLKVTVHKCVETIQGWKLFKGGNYMRKYGMYMYVLLTLYVNCTYWCKGKNNKNLYSVYKTYPPWPLTLNFIQSF